MDEREAAKQRLEERSGIIKRNIDLIERTQKIYEEHGSGLKSASASFEALKKSLSSSRLQIAVLGEYSRGKSSILNALLDMDELPTAQDPTTAINTFIYGLPEGITQPFLKIIWLDGREEELPLLENGQSTLEKWGTELVRENRDARQEVSHIELYIDNDLLSHKLTLIDTPGLETIHEHHEQITRRAIESAHMAIWVLSVQQHGGTRQEWTFFRETLRKSFRKFITLVNMWDMVLEPEDKRDKEMPLKEREREKLDIVRANFRKVKDLPEEALKILTSGDNLFGVSARWAQSDLPERRRASGIDKLFRRIRQIATSGEDREEILFKPLKELRARQEELADMLQAQLRDLEKNDSLEKRRADLKQLEQEIRGLELERQKQEQDARENHIRLCEVSVAEIEKDMLPPLLELQDEIDALLTPEYVEEMIQARQPRIELPPELKERFETTVSSLANAWESQRGRIQERLGQLNIDFAARMNKAMESQKTQFAALNMPAPRLELDCQVNFAPLETFYASRLEAERLYNSAQMEMERIEDELALLSPDEEALSAAREAVRRAEMALASQGSRPAPLFYQTKVQTSEGGWWSGPKFAYEDNIDDSAGQAYDRKLKEYTARLENREMALEKIQQEEFQKRGERMSHEAALRKLQRDLDRQKRELDALNAKIQARERDFGQRAYEKLKRSTSGQLENFANSLKKNAVEGVKTLFSQNLEALRQCVSEQIMEKLEAKKSMRGENIQTIQQGEAEIAAAKKNLGAALEKLSALQTETADSLR